MDTTEPSFFEQLQLLLVKLNEAFPARDDRAHNITLTEDGNIRIVVWDKNAAGNVCSWFIVLEEDDDLLSFDDVIDSLTKYVREQAQ